MWTPPISVFTKPWRGELEEIGAKLQAMGVDGVELPVRPGYPVNPENMQTALAPAVEQLARFGLQVYSVAGPISPEAIACCGAAGVGMIRIMVPIDLRVGYHESVRRLRAHLSELLPHLARNRVKIGLQNHAGVEIGSAIGLYHAIGDFDPQYIGAILDFAHCGLAGEPEAMAVDIVRSHLCLANFKNAYRRRLDDSAAGEAKWQITWTTGREGFVSWRKAMAALRACGYQGPLCLSAEYAGQNGDLVESAVEPFLQEDIAYLKALRAECA